MMPNYLVCGKELYASQGVPLERILVIEPNPVKDHSICLAKRSLSDIQGIEKLSLENCKVLYLQKNHLENIDPLLRSSSQILKRIYLQRNKLTNFSEENLRTLKENFPNLKKINLRKNRIGIEERKALRQAGNELALIVKLKKKTTTITIEDD